VSLRVLLFLLIIIVNVVDIQAESRCTEKLQAANGYYNMLLEEFGHVVGHEEAQNIHTLVTYAPTSDLLVAL